MAALVLFSMFSTAADFCMFLSTCSLSIRPFKYVSDTISPFFSRNTNHPFATTTWPTTSYNIYTASCSNILFTVFYLGIPTPYSSHNDLSLAIMREIDIASFLLQLYPSMTAFVVAPPLSTPPLRRSRTKKPTCATLSLEPARGPNARRLAQWLAADWDNKPQAMDNPQFWAHIHVCFRPLPWQFLSGYSFYTESAYDYNLGAPYKTSVVLLIPAENGDIQLASFKVQDPDEYWLGSHEPSLLQSLSPDQLVLMDEACNTVYTYHEDKQLYTACVRQGKNCIIRRGGVERETYLESTIELTADTYSAWDLGRDLETDERVWGTAAGPFVFAPLSRLDHLVPDEPDGTAS